MPASAYAVAPPAHREWFPTLSEKWVRELRHHRVVLKTLTGCKKLRAIGVTRKQSLTHLELSEVSTQYADSSDHDDKLFATMLLGGFHALHRLGEITWPDKKDLQDYRKVVLHHTVSVFS
jgi:hypothetical protein